MHKARNQENNALGFQPHCNPATKSGLRALSDHPLPVRGGLGVGQGRPGAGQGRLRAGWGGPGRAQGESRVGPGEHRGAQGSVGERSGPAQAGSRPGRDDPRPTLGRPPRAPAEAVKSDMRRSTIASKPAITSKWLLPDRRARFAAAGLMIARLPRADDLAPPPGPSDVGRPGGRETNGPDLAAVTARRSRLDPAAGADEHAPAGQRRRRGESVPRRNES